MGGWGMHRSRLLWRSSLLIPTSQVGPREWKITPKSSNPSQALGAQMLQGTQNPSSHCFLHASLPDLLTCPSPGAFPWNCPLAFRLRLSESLYLSKWLDILQLLSSRRTKTFAANEDNGYHLLSKLPPPGSVLRIFKNFSTKSFLLISLEITLLIRAPGIVSTWFNTLLTDHAGLGSGACSGSPSP